MEGMEEKLGAVLSNPELMQQIMSMAQSLGVQQDAPAPAPAPLEGLDPALLQKLMGLVRHSGMDQHQKALLQALSPYLRDDKLHKLEKAMRAAKMATLASSALSSGVLSSLMGG